MYHMMKYCAAKVAHFIVRCLKLLFYFQKLADTSLLHVCIVFDVVLIAEWVRTWQTFCRLFVWKTFQLLILVTAERRMCWRTDVSLCMLHVCGCVCAHILPEQRHQVIRQCQFFTLYSKCWATQTTIFTFSVVFSFLFFSICINFNNRPCDKAAVQKSGCRSRLRISQSRLWKGKHTLRHQEETLKGTSLQRDPILIWMTMESVFIKHYCFTTVYCKVTLHLMCWKAVHWRRAL